MTEREEFWAWLAGCGIVGVVVGTLAGAGLRGVVTSSGSVAAFALLLVGFFDTLALARLAANHKDYDIAGRNRVDGPGSAPVRESPWFVLPFVWATAVVIAMSAALL